MIQNQNEQNQNEQNQNSKTMLNSDFSMTNIEEVKEDIARDTAPVAPPTYEAALQPGFAGTEANEVRQDIQEDLQKAQEKRRS